MTPAGGPDPRAVAALPAWWPEIVETVARRLCVDAGEDPDGLTAQATIKVDGTKTPFGPLQRTWNFWIADALEMLGASEAACSVVVATRNALAASEARAAAAEARAEAAEQVNKLAQVVVDGSSPRLVYGTAVVKEDALRDLKIALDAQIAARALQPEPRS